MAQRKYNQKCIDKESKQIGWVDCEIGRDFEFNDIIMQSDDTEDDIWICPLCSTENNHQLQFCKECNSSYYGVDDNQYIQYNASRINKKRSRKVRKARKRKKRKPSKFSPSKSVGYQAFYQKS